MNVFTRQHVVALFHVCHTLQSFNKWCEGQSNNAQVVPVTQILHKTYHCIITLFYQGRLREYWTQEHLGWGPMLDTHQREDDDALD